MGEFINTSSAAIIGVLFVGIAALIGWGHRRNPRALAAIVIVFAVLFAGYWSARHGPSDVATLAEVDGVLAAGTPVILEYYSDT